MIILSKLAIALALRAGMVYDEFHRRQTNSLHKSVQKKSPGE